MIYCQRFGLRWVIANEDSQLYYLECGPCEGVPLHELELLINLLILTLNLILW